MKQTARCAVGKIVLLAAMALQATACSLASRQPDTPGQSRREDRPAMTRKLTQLDFGGQASYAACMEPACPAVTRKTLAVTLPSAALVPTVPTGAPQADDEPVADRLSLKLSTTLQAPPAMKPIHIQFGHGSAMLTSSEQSKLDHAIASVPEAAEISITGYTDDTGTRRANQRLAQARTRAVHEHLRVRLSAHQATLRHDAQAACCFLASNDSPQGRALNRRVDVVVRPPKQPPP